MKRKFILVPLGSAGDILPFVWLAEGLLAAGHDVVVVVHSPFRPAFRHLEVRTVAYGTAEDHEMVIRHPDLWHPRRGFALIARISEPLHRHALPLILQEIVPGRTTLVGAALAFAARIAAEARQTPLVTIQLQPMAFLSVADPPVPRAGMEWFIRSPVWVRRWLLRLGYWQTDWLLAEPINTLRAELGLETPVRKVLKDYWLSPQRVLGLFPEWFGPKASDWPAQAIPTRFPMEDGGRGDPLPELDTFLREGPPPIAFTPGSANTQASRFFDTAVEACRLLGCRGVLVTPYHAQLPRNLPRDVLPFAQAPFSSLFPQCRAVVHHGGIGTTAQALAAGIPQLIMPLSHDQPDNAHRVQRLGAGERLYPAHFTRVNVANRLRHLTTCDDVARICRELSDRMRSQMPRETVVRLIEETQ